MSKTFNATIKKTHAFQASVASILVHLDSSYESIPNGGVPYSALVKNSIADKDVKWQTVPLMVTNNEMLNALTDGGFVDLQLVMPEDDSGYQLGHVYQFRIINDVYSWEDITAGGVKQTVPYTIVITDWVSLSDKSPFDHKFDITFEPERTDDIVELINDNAVLFANYGFAIGEADSSKISIYAIGKPATSVTLTVVYTKGV